MPSEAQARITINKLLENASWRFLPDDDGNRENVVLEHRLSGRTFSPNADLGKDFERETEGMTDGELIEYFNRAGRSFRETGRVPAAEAETVVVREVPPKPGAKR